MHTDLKKKKYIKKYNYFTINFNQKKKINKHNIIVTSYVQQNLNIIKSSPVLAMSTLLVIVQMTIVVLILMWSQSLMQL